jgi:hypothetical protein
LPGQTQKVWQASCAAGTVEHGAGQAGVSPPSGQGISSDLQRPPSHGLLAGQLRPPPEGSVRKHIWVSPQSSFVEQGQLPEQLGRQVPESVAIELPAQGVATVSQ